MILIGKMNVLIYFSLAICNLCVVNTERRTINSTILKEKTKLNTTEATETLYNTQDVTINPLEVMNTVVPKIEITDSLVINTTDSNNDLAVTRESIETKSIFNISSKTVEDITEVIKASDKVEDATETAIEAPKITPTVVKGSTDNKITDNKQIKETQTDLDLEASKTAVLGTTDPTITEVVSTMETKKEPDLEDTHKATKASISTEINNISTEETKVVETTEVEVITNVICEVCVCRDREVDCSNNNLGTAFTMTDWDGLIDFEPLSVDLSQNPFTTLTRISNLTTLKYLNVSNCKIESIEATTFSYLTELVSLDLSGNRLVSSSVNKRVFVGIMDSKVGFLPFFKLRYLSLANNDIHSLAQDVFVFMSDLTTLDLSGNPLGYIDQVTMGAITDLEDLRELNLNGCKLETLPAGIFRRQHRLKRLDLSNNKFTTVPLSLGEAINLEYLDFSRNPIEIFNESSPISNLKKLKELHLNQLAKLQTVTDGALSGLSNLEVLDLSFNQRLSLLEDGFLVWTEEHTEQEMWPPLRELYLNNNNLSRIYSGYLERWDLLSRFDFSNNPYLCDCSNQWIVDVLVPLIRSSPSNGTLPNMICKKPKEMKGVSFMQLNNSSKILPCPDQELNLLPAPDMAILLGIMIGIFVTFPLVLVLVLLWRRGTFARCRSKRIDSDSDEEETDAF
ncbi:leucine-rich repeat neuronal protein 1 [Manduca sexta]|uniref:leucine-rich repeat neuronal protein 1 n=1 Tax=Manduca sexta TaxID=7130 RepID=UPI00188F62EB|nr:leucine-rich repeat neuronal protein 1 [Manduca sexta]